MYGHSNYVIPQDEFRQLVYAGFGGVYQRVIKAKRENRLGEGLFENLRQGNWLLDFYLDRVRKFKHNPQLIEFIERTFNFISMLPHYLIPKYFSDFIYKFMLTM